MKKDFKKSAANLFLTMPEGSGADPEQIRKEESVNIPTGYKLVKENKSERMQLLIRPSLKEAIRKEAAAQGLSMNDLINTIFEDYIGRQAK